MKKSNFKIFALILQIFLIVSCKHNIKYDFPNIDIPLKSEPISMNEIAKSIKYIQLETKPGSYISNILDLQKFGQYFLIKDRSGKVLIFTNEGKFIKKLGKMGEGPGEYNNAYSLAVNEDLGIIYLGSARKIQMYSKEFEFIKEIKSPHVADYLNVSDENLYLITEKDEQKSASGYIKKTVLFKLNKFLEFRDSSVVRSVLVKDDTLRGFTKKIYMSKSGNDTYLYTPVFYNELFLRDTLYEFKSDTIIPTIKFNFLDVSFSDLGYKNISIKNIFASKSYYICQYSRNNELMLFVYDKVNNKGYNTKEGFIDKFGEAKNISPLDLSNNLFYFPIYSEFTSSDEDELNPTIAIVELL